MESTKNLDAHTVKIYGVHFYKGKMPEGEIKEIPCEGWKFLGMIPGKYSEQDIPGLRKKAPKGATIAFIGQGETGIPFTI